MKKTELEKTEIDLILDLYFEEKMTVEEIEHVTPFDLSTINLLIKEKSTN